MIVFVFVSFLPPFENINNMYVRILLDKISRAIQHLLIKLDVIVSDDNKIVPLLTAGYVKVGKEGIKIPLRKTVKDG